MQNLDSWQKFYTLAGKFYKLAPWNFLEETDVFGVKSPLSGRIYFVSIMGSLGEFLALSAYEGATALGQFWDLQRMNGLESGDVLTIPHMVVSFEPAADTPAEMAEHLRQLGVDEAFGPEWPDVRHIIPGMVPELPEGEWLEDFLIILEQSLEVCLRARSDAGFIHTEDQDDDVYLIREESKHKDAVKWSDKYRRITLKKLPWKTTYRPDDLEALNSLPSSQTVLQAHFQMMPMPVMKGENSAFFPFLLLLTNKKTTRVEAYNLVLAEPDYISLLGSLPLSFMDFIKDLGFRPRTLEVKSPLLFEMLSTPMKQCGIRMVFFEKLPVLETAVDHIMESMRKEK